MPQLHLRHTDFVGLEFGRKCIPCWFQLLAVRTPVLSMLLAGKPWTKGCFNCRAVMQHGAIQAVSRQHPPGGIYLYKPSPFCCFSIKVVIIKDYNVALGLGLLDDAQ